MAVDLPLGDISDIVNDYVDFLGVDCLIDGIEAKVIMARQPNGWWRENFGALQDNMQICQTTLDVQVKRGSKIQVPSMGIEGIVYTTPNNALVDQSFHILIFDSVVDIVETQKQYSEETGLVIDEKEVVVDTVAGFIVRDWGAVEQHNVGKLHRSNIKFVTYYDAPISMNSSIRSANRPEIRYKVVDINDWASGAIQVFLESVGNER